MKTSTIEAILAKAGIAMVPDDHPVYSEGVSITFSSRTPKPSAPLDTASTPSAAQAAATKEPSNQEPQFVVDVTIPVETDSECPYCKSADSCEHHLMTFDITFGEALGGAACEWFGDQLPECSDDIEYGKEGDWRLQAIEEASDLYRDEEIDLGPCRSSMWRHFYCSTRESTEAAVAVLSGLKRPGHDELKVATPHLT